jgi:hypothetical protein
MLDMEARLVIPTTKTSPFPESLLLVEKNGGAEDHHILHIVDLERIENNVESWGGPRSYCGGALHHQCHFEKEHPSSPY